MKICHASDDTLHLYEPGSSLTLCGKPGGQPCPFIPLELFGRANDQEWCQACRRKAGHRLSAYIEVATAARHREEARRGEGEGVREAEDALKAQGILS